MTAAGCFIELPGTGRGKCITELTGATVDDSKLQLDLRPYLRRRVAQRSNGCAPSAAMMGVYSVTPDADYVGSWTALYALARQLETPTATRIADEGSYLHRIVEALETFGVCAESRWHDDVNLTERVTVDVLEAGQLATVTGVYRILERGEAWQHRARAALVQGHTLLYGSTIGDAYRAGPWAGTYSGESREEPMGHARLLVGCRPGAFLEVNPWGDTWDRWIDASFLSDGPVWGFYAFVMGPPSVR